jgi:hypothetical protein
MYMRFARYNGKNPLFTKKINLLGKLDANSDLDWKNKIIL